MKMRSRRRAFTLIELLIVVTIIAILAAIALPNFLQAQIRAKVSRAKADLRTITTGLEMYRVDYNNYPPILPVPIGDHDHDRVMLKHVFVEFVFQLTTPVAYLSSVALQDPFLRGFTTPRWFTEALDIDPEPTWMGSFCYFRYDNNYWSKQCYGDPANGVQPSWGDG